jgi:hypothetical protein
MYVDDSGSPSAKDNTDYYVISGLIIHETDIRQVEIRHKNISVNIFKNMQIQKFMFMIYSRVNMNFQFSPLKENTNYLIVSIRLSISCP